MGYSHDLATEVPAAEIRKWPPQANDEVHDPQSHPHQLLHQLHGKLQPAAQDLVLPSQCFDGEHGHGFLIFGQRFQGQQIDSDSKNFPRKS